MANYLILPLRFLFGFVFFALLFEILLRRKPGHRSVLSGENGQKPTIPCCTDPDFKPGEKQLELYRKLVK